MRTNEFIDQVASFGQFSTGTEAREATKATLVTLSQLLTEGEADDLAAQLPDDLDDWVHSTKVQPASGATFDAEGFLRRVADRLPGEVDKEQAEQQAHLVLTTLKNAITPGEWDNFTSQLPEDFDRLLN
jgi:uncharacterized protein (DUF2267 family)